MEMGSGGVDRGYAGTPGQKISLKKIKTLRTNALFSFDDEIK